MTIRSVIWSFASSKMRALLKLPEILPMAAGVSAVPVLPAGNFALAFLLGPAVVLLADLLESGWPRSGCFPGRVENIPVQRLVTFSSHRSSYKKEL
jgi:hypothetical protein